jgi:hypothetical protein
MIAKSTRYAVCLGLAGGLAVALTPAAQAQIQVTGGDFKGPAAFFVPTPGTGGTTPSGKVELFDLSIQTLNLETSKGNTSTAVFVPTAALFNAGSDNQPTAGDTGTVKGLLSGLAFTGTGGTPTPFTNREAIVNFSVNSFTNNSSNINGTLLSPQTAGQGSLIFLPNVEATVASGSSYQATSGDLQLGNLDADLTTGAINLPSTYTFQQTGSTATPPSTDTISRRVKFQFEGENVIPESGTNFSGTSSNTGTNTGTNNTGTNTGTNNTGTNTSTNNQLRFVGQANKKFTIETVGNQSNGQYKIDSTLGAVDIKINGPFTNSTSTGTLSNTASTTYKIQGESNGILSLFALNSVGFSSTSGSTSPSNTTFEFQQGSNKLTGSSSGNVNLYAVAGVNSFNSDTAFTNYQPVSPTNSTPGSNAGCTTNLCGNTLANNSSVLLGSTTITIGGPISVGTGSGNTSGGNNTSGNNTSGNTSGGNNTSGNNTSGNNTSGNTSGGNNTSGNTSGGNNTSGNTSGGNNTSGNTSGGNNTSGNTSGGNTSGGSCSGGCTDTDANAANTDVFASGGTPYSSTAQGQYQILASSNIRLVTDVKLRASSNSSKIKVKVVQRGSDRYYVVYREGSGSSSQGSSSSGSSSGTSTATGTGTGASSGTSSGTTTGGTTTGGTSTDTSSGTTTGGTSTDTSSGTTTGGTNTDTSSGTTTGSTTGTNTNTSGGTTTGSATGTNTNTSGGTTTGGGTTATGTTTGTGSNTGTGTASDDDQDDDQTASSDDQDDDQTASSDDQDDDQTASSDDQEVVYKVVGPSSRCFPGLTGLRQLSAEEAASVSSNNTSTSTSGNNNTSTPSNNGSSGSGATTNPQ